MRFSKISRKIVSKGKEFEDFTRWTCDVNNVLNQHFFQFPFSLFTAYQILRSERKNRSYFLSAILKCRIEKQNCTLKGLRKEARQSIWLFRKRMLYYLHTNEYVHGYVVFDFLQPFLMWRRNDHMFDHLRIWTTWKQCEQEYRKASVADTKDLEMLGK